MGEAAMAVVQGPFLVTVLLLVSPGLHCSSPLPACPESCTCQRAPLLNCSSSGLSSVPQHIQDSVTELDLSQNRLDTVTLDRPYRNLRNVWLENNTITRLSLCVDKNLGAQSVRGRNSRQLGPWSRRRCVSWAPTLQLLSVERNQLIQLPEGLEGSASLWVLQLSFNRISTIRPGELRHLPQLKELHLKHNLITRLHPQMFQDLTQLRVLDLSFNMLTSLHPSMYLSLRNIGSDVRLDGNRWQCDCSMRSLRRHMAYDSNRGLQTWSVECAFPSVLSGKDLLQLEEGDLNCFGTENSPELHQDVTVYRGSEILLSCSKQDSSWLMPSDQESVSQPQASLFISDISEEDTGLYVCMTEDHQVVSVFNLQISRVEHARRKARSVPRASPQVIPQERNQRATQSDLTLAVCLSVFITFLIAFILGVLVRPFIDVLWTKITKKRSPSATNSVSSAEQRQYENEAYSEGEEPEEIVTHRERRVTFCTSEDNNVEYYDTLASGNQESVEAAKTKEDEQTAGDSGSDNGSTEISPENNQNDARDISGTTDKRRRHKVQFEHIPHSKELEERRLSSCSDSSLSDRELKKDQMNKRELTTPKSLQQAEDSVQQGADSSTSEIVPQLSIERTSEIPGFSSEPFADWSPHANDTKPTDSRQGNEEQFDFSDSVGSNSARSSGMFGSFNDSELNVLPTSNNQSREDTTSCSSDLSEDEPTQYTVNPDQEEEEHTKNNHNKSELTNTHPKQDARFEQQISGVDTSRTPVGFNQGNYPHDTLRPAERSEQTFSSQSSDSEQMQYRGNEKAKKEEVMEYNKPTSRIVAGERDTRKKMKPMQRSKWRGVSLGVTSFDKGLDPKAPSSPTAHSSSSSSESEAEITDRKVKHNKGRKIKKNQSAASNDISNATNSQWPIKTTSPCTDADQTQKVDHSGLLLRESQTGNHDQDARRPALDHKNIPTINKRLDVKALSPTPDSSSSSDSEDETTNLAERPGRVVNAELTFQTSGTTSHDPNVRWPAIDLEHISTIKRRLDIKAPSPHPDSSSSSDSDDETTHLAERPGRVVNAELPFQTSGLTSHDPDVRWPAIDLENIPTIQRRLDIKAPSPHPDSSSSSDSDDETTHVAESPGRVVNAKLPFQTSGLTSHDPDVRWPAIDLENIPTIQRRLDVKAPSPHPDSSSSSDSDDETTHVAERPGRVVNAELPFQTSGLTSHDPDVRWPAIDLENIPTIQRRLDVKAPSPHPDSSSSSDSDDETTHVAERPGRVVNAKLPFQTSGLTSHDPDVRWPAIDLENIPTIQRRLEVKAPSPHPDSSSSSDSDDETTQFVERPGRVVNAELPFQTSGLTSHDPDVRWPAIDLENIPTIQRRLDVKAPSPHPDSSSSSDSDDETTQFVERPGRVVNAELPFQTSGLTSHDPDVRWPAIDLENIPTIQRRLDVKAPSPHPDSSSSSDSDDETTHVAERPGRVVNAKLPFQTSGLTSHDPDVRWPAIDLENIPTINRRLDVKAPSPHPGSSSSSDSDDETTQFAERPGRVVNAELPFQTSGLTSHDPDVRWPAIDLENIPTIQRRLDVKAPSPHPDSSSSSDSDDDTTQFVERPGRVVNSELPFQTSGLTSHDPDVRWPAIDLENIPTIQRRLDVKAPSPHPDSSSSSDSDDETTQFVDRPGRVVNAELPFQTSGLTSHDPDVRWPAIDLENIPTIRRRLDVKAPSPHPDSSSSSDSDDETTHIAERPGRVVNAELPFQTSGLTNHHPDVRWPAIDLENIPTINRRLDVKAPSPHPDSSSSSDSDDETTQFAERPGRVVNAELPFQTSGLTSHDPDVRWPAIDLDNIPTIQRRLDVKAPSPHPDSSSSSDSDDETTHVAERPGRVVNAELPFQTSGLTSHDPDVRWPAIDLENIPTIQRRLDVKAPSPHPDSSSSSDSDNKTTGHTEKTRPKKIETSGFLLRESQTANHGPDAGWAVLDLENIPTIKRHLDIKVPSLDSNSSSSSDDEEEVTHRKERPGKVDIVPIKKHEERKVNLSTFPLQESETVSHDPLGFALELNNITRIKRRLDIKAPSLPPTESSSSSDKSDSESSNIPVKVERDRTDVGLTNYQPGTQFPDRNKHLFPINRRLNIRGPPQPADPSFSSSDNGRLSSNTVRQETDKDGVGITTQEQKNMMHNINLGIPNVRRRLDIKAPSPQPDLVLDSTSADLRQSESNSSTSESEDENRDHKFKWSPKIPLIDISPNPKTDHNIKLEKYTLITDDLRNKPSDDNISPTPEINPELQSRWATMNLGISRFRKRLEITSHTNVPPNLPTSPLPDSPSSYTGESGTGNKSSRTRLKNLKVKVTEEKSNPDSPLSGFDTPHVSRYLDTKVHEKAPATSPLHQQSDSLFSSESEGISTEYAVNRWKGTSQLSVVPDVAAPQNRTSSLVTHAFDESRSGTQVERKAGVELKSHTSEEGDASDSMWPHISLTNIPRVKRALDIRTLLPRESSSSSNSEDETDHSVPDLKPGVPRINRRLNIKAPSPKPNTSSSSSSERDNKGTGYSAKQSLHSSYMSTMTDDDYSKIAYKRSIIKAPLQQNSFSSSGRSQTSDHPVAQAGLSHSVGDRSASLFPRRVSGIEQHGTLDVELTPEIQWKGIGRDLSDFSSASRHLDLGLLPPQWAPPAEPEHNPPDSSNFSHKIKQDGGKAYETLMHRYSYPTASRVSVASSISQDQYDNTSRSNNEMFRALSEDRKEKKGIGALKVMSSNRLHWDMEDIDTDAV